MWWYKEYSEKCAEISAQFIEEFDQTSNVNFQWKNIQQAILDEYLEKSTTLRDEYQKYFIK